MDDAPQAVGHQPPAVNHPSAKQQTQAYPRRTTPSSMVHRPSSNTGADSLRPPSSALRHPTHRLRRYIIGTLLGVLVLFVVLLGIGYSQVRGAAEKLVVADARPGRLVNPALVGGSNILLLGVDERPDNLQEGVRSDTLMVVRLDPSGGWVNLLSIPRDTYAAIPDFGAQKINSAYGLGYTNPDRYGTDVTPQQGGMALAAETVTTLFANAGTPLTIDYTAQINFEGFASIIDALGGVTIDVPKYILDEEYPTEDFRTMRVEFQPGSQRMDGQTALIYARTRHADSDFDRGARQQQVMRAILSEIKARNAVSRAFLLPRLVNGLEGTVTTTLPFDRLDITFALAGLAGGLDPDAIGQVQLSPVTDPLAQQFGDYSIQWSPAGLQQAVSRLTTPSIDWAEPATVQVLNGTGRSGLASQLTNELSGQGWQVTVAGDAPTTDATETIVYDVANKPIAARRLARALGGVPVRQGIPDGASVLGELVVVIGTDRVK